MMWIVFHNRTNSNILFEKESEIYFPLSPKFLAYVHFKGSNDKKNPLRNLTTNKIHIATDEQNIELQNIIMENPSDFVIFAGKFNYETR